MTEQRRSGRTSTTHEGVDAAVGSHARRRPGTLRAGAGADSDPPGPPDPEELDRRDRRHAATRKPPGPASTAAKPVRPSAPPDDAPPPTDPE